ncbi:hypothetical protein BKA66DRAFT_582665 [Pyrenochaeta sp. MPI-SDFR-AT-0127]|nr:hypothetical protein BKA66DRAFT_582665 [Pyrenochaeta sp. MPI-SDFR-AT-0127]
MSNLTMLPYLQPTGAAGVYLDVRTGQYVRIPMHPQYPQQPQPSQYSGLTQPTPPAFDNMPFSYSAPFSFSRSNSIDCPQNVFTGQIQDQWNGQNYFAQASNMDSQRQMQIRQQMQIQHQRQRMQEMEAQQQLRVQHQMQIQQQMQMRLQMQAHQQELQRQQEMQREQQMQAELQFLAQQQQQQQPRASAHDDVVIISDDDEPQVPVAPECSEPSNATLHADKEKERQKELPLEPPKKKEVSFLKERLAYLKVNIHDKDNPVAIRLLRTFDLNLDSKLQRKYSAMFWPSNEAALDDMREMAKLSPDFTEIYWHRVRWEAAKTDKDEGKIEAEKAKMELEMEELRGSCRRKYQEMLRKEKDAQWRTNIGKTRGHKGVAATKKEWEEYRAAQEEEKRQEGEKAEKRLEREEAALKRKEAAAQKKQEAAARRREEVESRKRKRAEDAVQENKRVKSNDLGAFVPGFQADDDDDEDDEMTQLIMAELYLDNAADTSSTPQEEVTYRDNDSVETLSPHQEEVVQCATPLVTAPHHVVEDVVQEESPTVEVEMCDVELDDLFGDDGVDGYFSTQFEQDSGVEMSKSPKDTACEPAQDHEPPVAKTDDEELSDAEESMAVEADEEGSDSDSSMADEEGEKEDLSPAYITHLSLLAQKRTEIATTDAKLASLRERQSSITNPILARRHPLIIAKVEAEKAALQAQLIDLQTSPPLRTLPPPSPPSPTRSPTPPPVIELEDEIWKHDPELSENENVVAQLRWVFADPVRLDRACEELDKRYQPGGKFYYDWKKHPLYKPWHNLPLGYRRPRCQ